MESVEKFNAQIDYYIDILKDVKIQNNLCLQTIDRNKEKIQKNIRAMPLIKLINEVYSEYTIELELEVESEKLKHI